MGLFDFWKKGSEKSRQIGGRSMKSPNASMLYNGSYVGSSHSIGFDGEKTYGEIGPVVSYNLDYYALATRSWKAYLDSDLAKTIFEKYIIWIVDKGLKLQSLPAVNALKSEGIEIDIEDITKKIESRFGVFSKSKRASFNGMSSLNELAKDAFKGAAIGGDILVVLRVKKGNLSIELIDGALVKGGVSSVDSKNSIINGVECDSHGRHIAYHVQKKNGGTERITAWSSSGFRMAFLVYGSKYKIQSKRGIPQIASSMESIAKMDRYKEASLKKAEESANIVHFVEHQNFSDGDNPTESKAAAAFDVGINRDDNFVPTDSAGQPLGRRIEPSASGTVYNMGLGQTLKSFEATGQMEFKEFYETNANPICSAVGIPPNVAFSIYNDSFSASRAATKDWDHTIDVRRDDFQNQFYNPIYALWLHLEIMKGKIVINGYLNAVMDDNFMVTEALYNCKFTGPLFPHIDPLKEVNAERAKLGPKFAHIPLTNAEDATERLNGGDYAANVEQAGKEIEMAEDFGIQSDSPSENNS